MSYGTQSGPSSKVIRVVSPVRRRTPSGDLHTNTPAQARFISWVSEVLVGIVVLNLFVEFVHTAVIDSFYISILTAVLLKLMVDAVKGLPVLLAFDERVRSRSTVAAIDAASTVEQVVAPASAEGISAALSVQLVAAPTAKYQVRLLALPTACLDRRCQSVCRFRGRPAVGRRSRAVDPRLSGCRYPRRPISSLGSCRTRR